MLIGMKCVAVCVTLMIMGFLLGELLPGDGPFSIGLSTEGIWIAAAMIPGVWLFVFVAKKWFEFLDQIDR